MRVILTLILVLSFSPSSIAQRYYKSTKPKTDSKKEKRAYKAFGIALNYSSYTQGDRTLEPTPDDTYDVSEFQGDGYSLLLHWDLVLDSYWISRLQVSKRRVTMEGDATLSGTSTTTRFELVQDFYGIGAGVKRYLSKKWWVMGEVDFSKATFVDLKVVGGAPANTSDVKKPIFVNLILSFGKEYSIGKKTLFTPNLKWGAVSTADPMINILELGGAFQWKL